MFKVLENALMIRDKNSNKHTNIDLSKVTVHQKAVQSARKRFLVDLEKQTTVDLTGKTGINAQMKVTLLR